MTGRRPRAAAAALLPAALLLAACTDVPSGADVPYSLEFERLPFPAVVAGDLLRDSTGAAAPLGAVAYNVDGAPIADAPIQYLFVGDAARLEDGALVRGVTAGDTVRITAVAGDVPSLPRLLWVVPRPDSLAGPSAAPDTLRWGIPPNPATDVSQALAVRLVSRVDAAVVPVRGWIVRFRIVVAGDTLAPSAAEVAWLVDEQGRTSAIDTTDTDGVASRRVRVNAFAGDAIDGLESLVVSVTPMGTTTPVAGAPVQITLPVARR